MGPCRTLGSALLGALWGTGGPHSNPIGTFGGVLLGSFGVIVGEGETPIWDPIGLLGVSY